MKLLSFSGKKDVLAVDLGTSEVKVLELKVSDDKISVIAFAKENISSLGIEEKSPEEKKQAYINVLKKLISSKKFSTKNCAISISGSSVIVRFVKFPKMNESDLEKTLQFEAEPHIPFDIQKVDMDTQIIGDIEEDHQIKMETILVASKKETIQEKVDIIEKAGLNPAIIDVDAFAVENAYEIINKEAASLMIILVNIGAAITNISIIENGIAKVVRDLYTAGNSFTRVIQNNRQISFSEAEELKKEYGLSGGGKENKSLENLSSGEDMASQIYNILYPVVRELNSEIQRSLDFFTAQQKDKMLNIEKIILSGGSANLKNLSEIISSELRLPVEIFRPLENAEFLSSVENEDMKSPALAVLTGLAIRKIGDNK